MYHQDANVAARARLVRASFVLGLALSGFFDGILLHQILQWHHFLSLVPGDDLRDLRTQILADGLFHVFVYVLTALGLVLLWRTRGNLTSPGAGRKVIGGALLGFGAWNMIDVGFFHWILGIHRIRVNVPNPLIYDLVWFFGLGAAVALIGLWVLRGGSTGETGRGGRMAFIGMIVLFTIAVPVANLPASDGNTLIVPRSSERIAAIVSATAAANGRLVLVDPEAGMMLVRLPREASHMALYRAGAMFVTRSPALSGCLAFTDTI
jgi:uncharacterized membrane protein